MTETSTATTALAELEQAIIDGAEVTAAELIEARAAVDVEKLTEIGNQTRRARRAAEKAAAVREKGKADAAEIMAEHSSADILAAYDQARAAYDRMMSMVHAHNDAIDRAAQVMYRAGVGEVSTMPEHRGITPEHYDARNVIHRYQDQTPMVTVDGKDHHKKDIGGWAASLTDASYRAPSLLREQLPA